MRKACALRRLRNQSAFNVNVFVCSVTYLGDVIEGNTARAPPRERSNDEAPERLSAVRVYDNSARAEQMHQLMNCVIRTHAPALLSARVY
jgi:hypothetical protein